jgi:hypothetical protein
MRVHIQLLRGAVELKEQLRRSGWIVESVQDGTLVASHEGVTDERDARLHFQRLGLLTSSQVRIHFPLEAAT